jgi:hypothetical protein
MGALKRYTLVLNFGYVESQRLAYMPWSSKQKFKDAKEALLDLANWLKEQFLIENEVKPRKCCLAAVAKDAEIKYCPKCGLDIAERAFDGEEFEDWVQQLDSDIDTFHGLIPWDPDARWQADGAIDGPNLRIVYQAHWVLSAALGQPHHEDHTWETICKARTKSRQDSFTYF